MEGRKDQEHAATGEERRKEGKNRRKARAVENEGMETVAESGGPRKERGSVTTEHGGPVWDFTSKAEGGAEGMSVQYERSRSSVGHWDVARGRDERGSHLQSVPVGQGSHLWAR